MWQVFPLRSAEQWSSSASVPQALGELSSSCWALPLQTSTLLNYWLPSLLCVTVGEVSAVGPLQTVLGTRCLTVSQPPWCYTAFLPPPAAQPPAAGGSFTWRHLLQAGLLPVAAPGERTRHFLQSEVCTAASPFIPRAAWQNLARLFHLNAQLYFLLWAWLFCWTLTIKQVYRVSSTFLEMTQGWGWNTLREIQSIQRTWAIRETKNRKLQYSSCNNVVIIVPK